MLNNLFAMPSCCCCCLFWLLVLFLVGRAGGAGGVVPISWYHELANVEAFPVAHVVGALR